MADFLGKKYKLESSENFDEYMKAIGVGLVVRKIGNNTSSTVELTESGGVYTLKIDSTFKNTSISFKLGEEIDEETMDGRKVKTVFTMDGNKLIQHQKGEKETTIVRQFTPTQLECVCTIGDIVCTRLFKIVA